MGSLPRPADGDYLGQTGGALGATVGHRAPPAQERRLGHWPLKWNMQRRAPGSEGELPAASPASWTYTGVVARSVGATAQAWGLKPEAGVPGFQPPSATVPHMGLRGHTERGCRHPQGPCAGHIGFTAPTALKRALSNPSGLSRALSGHHGPPPSQPVQTAGSWREGNGCVTPSTWPGPEGHPSCLRVRAAPARPTPWPTWKPRLKSHGRSCQPGGPGATAGRGTGCGGQRREQSLHRC